MYFIPEHHPPTSVEMGQLAQNYRLDPVIGFDIKSSADYSRP